MQKYSTSQYNDIFYKLPTEIQDVLIRYDTSEHLWKIGEKHKLQIDKVGIMHDLSMDVMMGIIASKNFVRELQNELGIPALDASALARDIDEEIFKPIKNTMIKIYGDGAPYKPSSTLVQFYEEEEEHKALDKDALLKEIENPAEAVMRREEVKTTELETVEEVKELKDMARLLTPERSDGGQEKKAGMGSPHPDPLLNKERVSKPIGKTGEVEIKKIGMHLDNPPPPQEGISSTLDRLASLKLSKTFVMPKTAISEELSAVSFQDVPKSGIAEVKDQKLEAKSSKLEATKPYTPPAPKKYSADPYREPLS